MQKNEIWKIYGTDYKEMTVRLLEAAQLAEHIPPQVRTVGIKPNLVSPSEASWGATTHPQIVEGIAEYLRVHGDYRPVILEGSWVGDRTAEAFETCGYSELSKRLGLELWDMQKDACHIRDCAGMNLSVCDKVAQIDYLINVPVLKGHCQTKVTCALKNLKGLIPNKEKRRFHALGLHDPIAHLAAGIRQDFIVVDHICGDLDFEDGGHPVVRNCIMAALDPVLTDAYACSLLHYETAEVPYILKAESLGVGSADLNRLRLRFCGSEEREELPRSDKVVELSDVVQEVESCSACYGYLLPALDMLREEGLLEPLKAKLPGRICIGQGFRGQKGRIGVGNCTRNFDFSVPGCPPTETEIYLALKEYLRG